MNLIKLADNERKGGTQREPKKWLHVMHPSGENELYDPEGKLVLKRIWVSDAGQWGEFEYDISYEELLDKVGRDVLREEVLDSQLYKRYEKGIRKGKIFVEEQRM